MCDCITFRGDRLPFLLREYEGPLGGQQDLPDGKFDVGEESVEATARELREEAGLRTTEVSEFAHYFDPDLGGENPHSHMATSLVRETDDTWDVQLSSEHLESKWVVREQFNELPAAWYTRRVLDNVERGTINTHHGESD